MARRHLSNVIRLNPFTYSQPGFVEDKHHAEEERHPWWRVLWLTGVDYFSTLAYQPGIAFLAAGALSPLATMLLVLVTVFGALPVYAQVASRSFAGQGSIAMLERMLKGWWSKSCVLVLLGFAATDFTITMTLSAADASQHIVENPYLSSALGSDHMFLTLTMLGILGFVFIIGFKEAIRIAMLIAVPYILLNTVVLGAAIIELVQHPEHLSRWTSDLAGRGDFTGILLVCAFVFPKLALGMSGFETAVSTMPLISDGNHDLNKGFSALRVANTRKLLVVAAALMSVMLILSSFATTLLIEPAEFGEGGRAYGRAISYLAHQMFGWQLGTAYDISTVAILWFAGASAMTGLLQIIPRYLPKFGMAPAWVANTRPLVILIVGFNFAITYIFNADVAAQGGAYATGVLVLILSASVAVTLSLWRESSYLKSLYFAIVTVVFAYTLVDNVLLRVDGIIVAAVFVTLTIVLSMFSRSMRATEMRVSQMKFKNESSARKWELIEGRKVHLVAIRGDLLAFRKRKAEEIRKHYSIEGPIAFLHIELADDRSEFTAGLEAEITKEEGNFFIQVRGANSIANTIAFMSEVIRPKSIFLSLTRKNPLGQALRFLLWGEGETGLMVYRILLRQWEKMDQDEVRPFIFLMSD